MTWRTKAAKVIREVIRKHGTQDMPALKVALRKAYPFHERKFHPYKIWLDEIKVQLGTKRLQERQRHEQQRRQADQLTGQRSLFE
jgi:hypothetical protein